MKIVNFKLKISAVLPILGLIFLSNGALPVSAQTPLPTMTRETQVTISASIGAPVLKLWGYGPPGARIELGGDRVSDFTYSATNGYFKFPKTYLPAPSDIFYPELCLIAIDQIGRATPPTCIPGLAATIFNFDIGPVILPPTISITDGASGITIPDSEVKIVLAEDGRRNFGNFALVREAKAYYIPDYTVKSDDRGYFSFNMPDSQPNTWNVFAITKYSEGTTSPKSNTLKFEVISPALGLIQSIWAFIISLVTLPGLIILEMVVILLIVAFSQKKWWLAGQDLRRLRRPGLCKLRPWKPTHQM